MAKEVAKEACGQGDGPARLHARLRRSTNKEVVQVWGQGDQEVDGTEGGAREARAEGGEGGQDRGE